MPSRIYLVLAGVVLAALLGAQVATGSARVFTLAGASDVVRRVQVAPPRDRATATAVNVGGSDVAVAADGAVLVADGDVWRIGLDGRLWRVAGTGHPGFSGDGGPARAARVSASAIAVMADGGTLIADSVNHRIRRVWPDGTISTVAGSGPSGASGVSTGSASGGFGGDGGPATAARLDSPSDVAVLGDGGFLIADTENHRIRRVWPDATITTVAGGNLGAKPEGLGDGGPATAAALDTPAGVAVTPDGGFVIADSYNERIARVAPDGTISTLAGNGNSGFRGDGGPATRARLNFPTAVAVGAAGEVFIADSTNDRVRRVGPDGRISTVAGSSREGEPNTRYNNDGEAAIAAVVPSPASVEPTPDGGLVIAADGVRYVAPTAPQRLAVALLGRRGRATSRGYRARIITTVPAHVTLWAHVDGTLVRAAGQTAAGSPATLTLDRSFAPGVYSVAVTATTEAGMVATQAMPLILGDVLSAPLAKRAIEQLDFSTEGTVAGPTLCHRFGARRVDCKIEERIADESSEPPFCAAVVAVWLTASGLLRERDYACVSPPHPLFRRHPKWREMPAWLDIPSRP
jgi:NHL repeat